MIPPLPNDTTTLVLRRAFSAPRQRVFRAWIEPEPLQQWFRPLGMSVIVRKLEPHVGGSFHFDIENGTSTSGTYLQIVPPEKLVFTWSGETTQFRETIVTLDFLDQGPMTELVLTHERVSTSNMHERFKAGWQSLLEALTEALSLPQD